MFGMGLRHQHYEEILNRLEVDPSSLRVDHFEIITENFLDTKGRAFINLKKISEHIPICFHGVSLSIASDEEFNWEYLNKIKKLEKEISPLIVSDHLCWTGTKHKNLHNLLPIPYTKEELNKISDKVLKLQDFFKRPMVFENLSAYVQFKNSEMTEAEFFKELHLKTGCEILLDINNLYVNLNNFNCSIDEWFQIIPKEAVKEMHLAGFTDMGQYYFDTHSNPIHSDVWEYYHKFKIKFNTAITTVEWDEDLPSYDRVADEVQKAKLIGRQND